MTQVQGRGHNSNRAWTKVRVTLYLVISQREKAISEMFARQEFQIPDRFLIFSDWSVILMSFRGS